MGVSENYIPQSENLDQVTRVVRELHEIRTKNSLLKNKIVNDVDDLILRLNGDKPDYSTVIEQINDFLSQYKTEGEQGSVNGIENGKWNETQKEILESQNVRLKHVLESKREYNRQIEIVTKEYELGINEVMKDVSKKKFERDLKKLEQVKRYQKNIESAKQDEFKAYKELIEKEMTIYQICELIIEQFETFEQNRGNEISGETLKKLLQNLHSTSETESFKNDLKTMYLFKNST